jgi:hypothetical protein
LDGEPVSKAPRGDRCVDEHPRPKVEEYRRHAVYKLKKMLQKDQEQAVWEDATHVVVIDESFHSCLTDEELCGLRYVVTVVPYNCSGAT